MTPPPPEQPPTPAQMWAEIGRIKSRIDDMESALVRLRGEMRQDFCDAIEGLKEHSKRSAQEAARAAATAVSIELSEVKSQLGQLEGTLGQVLAKANAAEDYREERKRLEEQDRQHRTADLALESRELAVEDRRSKIRERKTSAVDSRIDGTRKHRIAVLTALATIGGVLLTLLGMVLGSHSTPAPPPTHHE